MQYLPASQKVTQKFYFNEIRYKITFNYVTFAAIWNGQAYVVAVDYDRYVIIKHCPVKLSKHKHVPCDFLNA